MSKDIINMLETIKTYFTNNIQEIIVCRHKETGKLYFLNNIYNKEIFDDVDLKKLLQNVKNIKEIIETSVGLCIISEYFDCCNLIEYIKNSKLSLSRGINFTTFIVDNLVKLKEFPPYILKSLFNTDNIIIDENENINISGLIILGDDYSEVTMSQIFKNLADIFYTIFTGNTISNDDIDKNIPPIIDNIINKCLNGQYLTYLELAKEFKESKIYKLMNPEVEESQRIYSIRRQLKNKRRKRVFTRVGLLIITVTIISLPFILNNIKSFKHNSETVDGDLDNPITVEKEYAEDKIGDEVYASKDDDEDKKLESERNIYESNEENLFKFYNEDFLEKCKDETNIGFLDEDKYHKGNCSVKIENIDGSKKTFIIGGIDIEGVDFKYIFNRDVSLSFWTNSENDIDAIVTVKTMQGNNILAKYSKKIYIPKNTWSLQHVDLKSVNGDYLKIYLTTSEKGTIWIDSFEIDVLK